MVLATSHTKKNDPVVDIILLHTLRPTQLEIAAAKDEQSRNKIADFIPIKITSLLSPKLLEVLTEDVQQSRFDLNTPLLSLENMVEPDAWAAIQAGVARLTKLCEASKQTGVDLLFDAEQSYRQPAVHMFVWHLMSLYNRDGASIVYDTFQMYIASKVSLDISTLFIYSDARNVALMLSASLHKRNFSVCCRDTSVSI